MLKPNFVKRVAQFCAMAVLSIPPVAHAGTPGIFSLTIDDASVNAWNGYVIARNHGINGTILVTTSIGGKETGLSWDQLRTIHGAGWEIGAHTHIHTDLTTQNRMSVELEMEYPKYKIKEEIGVTPVSFATPFSRFNEKVLDEIGKHYQFNLVQGFAGGMNDLASVYPLLISRYDIGSPTTNATEVCNKIAEGARKGQWVVLLVHEIVAASPTKYQIDATVYEDIMRCTKKLIDEGTLVPATVSGGYTIIQTSRGAANVPAQ